MKLNDIAEFIKKVSLPLIYLGLFSLYAMDILCQLYYTGKVSDGTEKELIGLVSGALVLHQSSKRE
jgi:hypothetical protein